MYILGTFGSLLYNFLKMLVKFQPCFITQFHSLLPDVTNSLLFSIIFKSSFRPNVRVK